MPDPRPPHFLPDFADAAGAYGRVAEHLAAGARDPAHPFHWPALGTLTRGVGAPVVRTVVLRAFDAAGRVATFHTDSRSPKVSSLRLQSLALHFYDHPARFQVRMPARASLHHLDAVAEAEWAALSDHGRAQYGVPDVPGAVLRADAPVTAPPPVTVGDRAAFGNFLAVRCHFDGLELLELRSEGNRRAVLAWTIDGYVRLVRLAP